MSQVLGHGEHQPRL